MNNAIEILKLERICRSDSEFPVNFDDAWKWVGYATKGSAKRKFFKRFKENTDYQLNILPSKTPKGRPRHEIMLTIDALKGFGLMAETEQGDKFRELFIAIQKKFSAMQNAHIPEQAVHLSEEVQKLNSRIVNRMNAQRGGITAIKDHNRQNCMYHDSQGRRPSELKKYAELIGYKTKDRSSGKQVLRKLEPEAACAMSLADTLVSSGFTLAEVYETTVESKKLFAGLLKIGVIPGELKHVG